MCVLENITINPCNRLKDIGAWLAKNGESIYGTRGGPWKPMKAIAIRRKGNSIYIHIMKSEDGRIELPALPVEIKSAARLDGGKVSASQKQGKLVMEIPVSSLNAMDTIVKLELNHAAIEVPALNVEPEPKQ